MRQERTKAFAGTSEFYKLFITNTVLREYILLILELNPNSFIVQYARLFG